MGLRKYKNLAALPSTVQERDRVLVATPTRVIPEAWGEAGTGTVHHPSAGAV